MISFRLVATLICLFQLPVTIPFWSRYSSFSNLCFYRPSKPT